MQTIVVVDDHPIVRQGLIRLIASEPDFRVVGEAEDSDSALQLVRAVLPSLALVDLSLKNSSGIELVKDITALLPAVKVLVVSLHEESVYAERALRAGALGFIMKSEAINNILVAIKEVVAGHIYLSPSLKTELLGLQFSHQGSARTSTGIESLSDREVEVLQLLGEGKGPGLIAEALNLSVKTVETYKSHIKQKLNLRDTTALVQYAVKFCLDKNL